MLGDNYLTFNGEALPNPTAFSIAYTNIESTKQSEAGYDIAIVTRLEKRAFTGSFQVTSTWKDKLKTLCNLASGTLVYRGESITVRPRLASAALLASTEYSERTDGLWTVSITFTEV